MIRDIYRKQALERLASPEQLDQLMPLTRPREWVALAAIGLLIAGALFWSVFGTIRTTVEGSGILTRSEGVRTLTAEQPGIVGSISAEIGDEPKANQELMRIMPSGDAGAEQRRIVSPGASRVLDIAVGPGDAVDKGTPLLTLESLAHPLQAAVFLPAAEAFQIETGMEVQVFLGTDRDRNAGMLNGRVKVAAGVPATQSRMMMLLQSEEWVANLTRNGPCFEIIVDLDSKSSRSEIASMAGIHSGTPCRVAITVDRRSPLHMAFPGLKGGGGA
ncbi:MAG: HlyD family efflux transporter periplasmic adaptor subunit [Deltaproteobacteria bacterium]